MERFVIPLPDRRTQGEIADAISTIEQKHDSINASKIPLVTSSVPCSTLGWILVLRCTKLRCYS